MTAAIPKCLFVSGKHINVDKGILDIGKAVALGPNTEIDLCKMKCKDYYRLFIEGKYTCPTVFRKWSNYFDRDITKECENCSKHTKAICQDIKVLQTTFKLLHHINFTKRDSISSPNNAASTCTLFETLSCKKKYMLFGVTFSFCFKVTVDLIMAQILHKKVLRSFKNLNIDLWFGENINLKLLRVSPHENHASESTVHLTDFPQIWHTCVTSLVHQPGATVWFNCLLFWRNVNQTVRQWKVFKFEVKIYSMFDHLLQV